MSSSTITKMCEKSHKLTHFKEDRLFVESRASAFDPEFAERVSDTPILFVDLDAIAVSSLAISLCQVFLHLLVPLIHPLKHPLVSQIELFEPIFHLVSLLLRYQFGSPGVQYVWVVHLRKLVVLLLQVFLAYILRQVHQCQIPSYLRRQQYDRPIRLCGTSSLRSVLVVFIIHILMFPVLITLFLSFFPFLLCELLEIEVTLA